MSLLALHLHDAGIAGATATSPAGSAVPAGEERRDRPALSPGVALLDEDGSRVLLGRAAEARARLSPRRVHRRFWRDLAQGEPAGAPFPPELTTADLAWAHLEAVWSEWRESAPGIDRVLLVLPGSLDGERLALVAGLARGLGMPLAGMVDAAAAAGAWALGREAGAHPLAGAEAVLHADLELHRLTVSELIRLPGPPPGPGDDPAPAAGSGALLARRGVRVSDEVGLAGLTDLWARHVADLFVRATRFDPLHAAASEQALYDGLPDWLDRLGDAAGGREAPPPRRLEVQLSEGGASIELAADELAGVAAGAWETVAATVETALASLPASREVPDGESAETGGTRGVPLLLSSTLAGLPGLAERLSAIPGVADLHPLPPRAAALGALATSGSEDPAAGAEESLLLLTALSVPPPGPGSSGPADRSLLPPTAPEGPRDAAS